MNPFTNPVEKKFILQIGVISLPHSFTFQFVTEGIFHSKDVIDCLRTRRRELGKLYLDALNAGEVMPWEQCDYKYAADVGHYIINELMRVGEFYVPCPKTDGGTSAMSINDRIAIVCERLPLFQKPTCKVPPPCYN